MTSGDRSTLDITEQAAEWLLALDEASPRERAAFIAWLKESPRHLGEFLAVSGVSRAFDGFDAGRRIDVDALVDNLPRNVMPLAAGCAPEAHPPSRPAGTGQRRWIGAVAATMAVIALAGGWLLRPASWHHYRTAVGEQRSIELADGSVVHVNTSTRLDVRFSDGSRDLRLLSGEALFDVARDPARPFRVAVGNAVVQALGTRFNVYRREGRTTVAVLEGKVRLSSEAGILPQRAPQTESLAAGEVAGIAADGHLTPVTKLGEAESVTAWRQRQLVFRSDRLADIASEFNRYNRTPQIRVEGKKARDRRLTGIFNADDPESLVLFLSKSDLTVRREDGAVVIGQP